MTVKDYLTVVTNLFECKEARLIQPGLFAFLNEKYYR
jgi:hypothetical protein